MPGVDTHDKVTLAVVPLVAVCGLVVGGALTALLLASSFLFAGFMLNGDLDHAVGSRPYRRWGPLRFIWWPYKETVHHRSKWSHWPILGTASRLCVLAFVAGFIMLVLVHFGAIEPISIYWIDEHRTELLTVVIGLELGSLSHSIVDWLT